MDGFHKRMLYSSPSPSPPVMKYLELAEKQQHKVCAPTSEEPPNFHDSGVVLSFPWLAVLKQSSLCPLAFSDNVALYATEDKVICCCAAGANDAEEAVNSLEGGVGDELNSSRRSMKSLRQAGEEEEEDDAEEDAEDEEAIALEAIVHFSV